MICIYDVKHIDTHTSVLYIEGRFSETSRPDFHQPFAYLGQQPQHIDVRSLSVLNPLRPHKCFALCRHDA